MNDIVVATVGAVSMVVGAFLTLLGVLWKAKKEREAKQIEHQTATTVARIEADSSQRINIVEVLAARVSVLETAANEQDRLVMKLTRENAVLEAKNQLLSAENSMLERDNKKYRFRVRDLETYNEELKTHIQTEVSDARYKLEEASEPMTDE